jgi:uncharacterized membrane protein
MIPRYFFAFVFVVFLPGYCLVNLLFIGKNKLDFVEEIVLSVALSFGLDGLVGLFLGLSPIGIDFVPITVSLTIIVLIFAIGTFLRKRKELPVLQVESPQQVST